MQRGCVIHVDTAPLYGHIGGLAYSTSPASFPSVIIFCASRRAVS